MSTKKKIMYPLTGAYIKELRKSAGLTQAELNKKFLGFPHYTIMSNFESGRTKLPVESYEPLAKAFNVDLFEFTKRCMSECYPELFRILFRKYQAEKVEQENTTNIAE